VIRAIAVGLGAVLVAGAAAGADGGPAFWRGGGRRSASAGAGRLSPADEGRWPEVVLPHCDGAAAPRVRFKLDEAYRLAVRAIREQASCAALFTPFHLRGEEALAATSYGASGDEGDCLRPAVAFTCVGCSRTVLCPAFLRLQASVGATMLIHEALHFGGLRERPQFPGAMSSSEISALVRRNCRP